MRDVDTITSDLVAIVKSIPCTKPTGWAPVFQQLDAYPDMQMLLALLIRIRALESSEGPECSDERIEGLRRRIAHELTH